MAPIFVISFAYLSFLPTSHTTQAQLRSQLQSTSLCCRCRRPTSCGSLRSEGGSNTGRWRGDRGIAAATTAALVPWARPPTRCARAGAALAASDREGFDTCGEEDRGKRPAHDGNDTGTGGSRRVAAPRPHRQQLRGLDTIHSESTAMAVTTATGREHEDGDCGGNCEDMTMEVGSHCSLGDRVLRGRRGRWWRCRMPSDCRGQDRTGGQTRLRQ